MDNIFKYCGFFGLLALFISSCSAVPKYETANKRWIEFFFLSLFYIPKCQRNCIQIDRKSQSLCLASQWIIVSIHFSFDFLTFSNFELRKTKKTTETNQNSIHCSSHTDGKGGQWDRSYKENDTYAAPTSDRVERLGYSPTGYGSVNVILPSILCFV